MSFTVVSTFSGCGGSSFGYESSGGKVRLAVEWNDLAVASYHANFPDTPVYHGDIAELSNAEALEMAGLKRGELDVLDGSPPCQGFSTSGKRMLHDARNSLFMEYARLLKAFRPKVMVMENVSGMVKGKMKLLFVQILRTLKDSGYDVSAKLIDAAYFGVPQHRQRMIFIGVREDLKIRPSHPGAQNAPLSLQEALRGVKNTDADIADSKYKDDVLSNKLLKVMRPGETGDKYHPRNSHYGLRRLQWGKTPGTVQSEDGSHVSCAHCHPTAVRRLTIPELKRVSSFPDDFILRGAYKNQWAQIGNSVPPKFMQAIAEHIQYMILSEADDFTKKPSQALATDGIDV